MIASRLLVTTVHRNVFDASGASYPCGWALSNSLSISTKCPIARSRGVAVSTMNPQCPHCPEVVTVEHATFLMADHSRPTLALKTPSAR
jgi:hypothetical protein